MDALEKQARYSHYLEQLREQVGRAEKIGNPILVPLIEEAKGFEQRLTQRIQELDDECLDSPWIN